MMVILAAALIIIAISAVLLMNQKSKSKVSAPSNQGNQNPVQTSEPTAAPINLDDTEGKPLQNLTVEASDYSFSPSSFTVKKGERVELVFKNNGSNPHNFVLEELGVNTQTLSSGQSETLIFTALKSGTFTYYCAVGNHRDLGMEGKLTVE
jgi:plastocyanin